MGDELTTLKNIGPKSAARLREAGVRTREQLEALGAVAVYRRLRAHYPASLTMLWALQGALLDLACHLLPPEIRAALLDELAEKERQMAKMNIKRRNNPYYNLVE